MAFTNYFKIELRTGLDMRVRVHFLSQTQEKNNIIMKHVHFCTDPL